MLRLYNTLLLPLRPLAALWSLRHRGSPERGAEAGERMARRLPAARPGGVWIHGSSVGEARIVTGLAQAVRSREPERPISVSAYTRTGRAQLPDRPPGRRGVLRAAGLQRAARAASSGRCGRLCLVIVETELWPNLLDEAHRSGAAVALVNGASRRSGWSATAGWPGSTARCWSGSPAWAPSPTKTPPGSSSWALPETAVRVTGNVKYDLPAPVVDEEALRREIGLEPGRPVLVAGSTGPGEDGPVLDAFAGLRVADPRLFLILAPRHPERADEVEQLARSRGYRVRRLSGDAHGPAAADVLLVDTVGRLGALYELAIGRVRRRKPRAGRRPQRAGAGGAGSPGAVRAAHASFRRAGRGAPACRGRAERVRCGRPDPARPPTCSATRNNGGARRAGPERSSRGTAARWSAASELVFDALGSAAGRSGAGVA